MAQDDQTISFDGHAYNIFADQRLHISNSYKFKQERMESLFLNAGFREVVSFGKNTNPMKLTIGKI
jgi:uncharacterized SAM-dependent methyltransferase